VLGRRHLLFAILLGVSTAGIAGAVQRAGAFSASRDHAAIAYSTAPTSDVAALLNRRLTDGSAKLTFDPVSGYLRSLLAAFDLPIESQVLVYSETSFQARKINRKNPRAVYFNDRVAVGWVRGGDILEISAQDPRQGTVYYTLAQTPAGTPRLTRSHNCLSCHLSWDTLAVPGPFVLTTMPRRNDSEYANGGVVDHATPLADRWSGWFVTGMRVPKQQFGNVELIQPHMPATGAQPVPAKPSVEGEFDLQGYPTPYSDIVALMLLEHQAHATNLITRLGWEHRVAAYENGEARALASPRVQEAITMLVDYFLFKDEAPLPSPIRGSSKFAEVFQAAGARDTKGRSLRDLDLDTRLMRYPCSYMIYSPGFDGLPADVRAAIYKRLSDALAGSHPAVVEILRATKPDFATKPSNTRGHENRS
jgi:hypothetical protein